jgi:hypothetical protein
VLGKSVSNGSSRLLSIYSLSIRIMSHGTQASPASENPIFSFGNRAGTPVSIMLNRFAIIEIPWDTICAENIVLKQFKLNGNVGKIAVTLCSMTGKPVS